ncbi:GNAT family N-acetyltransferase [Porticoccus sp. W117]|uniref:GNAT family N-acetyltransferase n=1 Tax=Porticoccus sp. W117 TaxID=3054777 RepID=UPI00259305C5|nr:GNAT family N-acetyltransferase [Porticoccus sp. W117]MDM3870430.1 GNAT family N-acetyltransferase [Porticoccus sp. W117]
MEINFYNSIDQFAASEWNSLLGCEYPFLQYDFLQALEHSGSVCRDTGWQPRHMGLTENGQIIAALPLYEKYHSWGEYVFDWSWADAYQRLDLPYYPKLLSAVPFTPATGPRILLAPGGDAAVRITAIADALRQYASAHSCSGVHLLFPDSGQDELLGDIDFLQRRSGTQFHWFNRGYNHFDDFLAVFNARKRKTLRSERRKVAQLGLTIERVEGPQISGELWDQFYPLYHRTYLKRSGGTGYLNRDFFQRIGRVMAEQIMLVTARGENGDLVAAGLFFRDSDTLYGRYWGTAQELDGLHFELCYYQGIEYAIEQGLQRFDAGAQGEHKIRRGFEPVETCSYHWLADGRFNDAIREFLAQEKVMNKRYMEDAGHYLPYK